MPVPIIELQRRLTLVGAIRAGGERPPDGRRPGKKLQSFRLTSPRRSLIEQAAELYGGDVSAWKSPVGDEWQVYTEAPELPVLVMPGYSLRQSYELWEGATKRTRLCDGLDEELSGRPCLCEGEGVDRCDLYTRLVVALPELDTVLGWRLITRGANAAHELPTMFALVESRVSPGQSFVPARLRIDERRGVKDGQVVRFVVPVLDLGIGYVAFAANDPARSLPPARENGERESRYVPAPDRSLAVRTALESVREPLKDPRRSSPKLPSFGPVASSPEASESRATAGAWEDPPGRSSSSLPTAEQAILAAVEQEFGPSEVELVGTEYASADVPAPTSTRSEVLEQRETARVREAQTKMATGPQKKKLDVLVGRLRDNGHLLTTDLWRAIAKSRDADPLALVAELRGREDPSDESSRIRWAPLREALTRVEANDLIDRLDALDARVREATS